MCCFSWHNGVDTEGLSAQAESNLRDHQNPCSQSTKPMFPWFYIFPTKISNELKMFQRGALQHTVNLFMGQSCKDSSSKDRPGGALSLSLCLNSSFSSAWLPSQTARAKCWLKDLIWRGRLTPDCNYPLGQKLHFIIFSSIILFFLWANLWMCFGMAANLWTWFSLVYIYAKYHPQVPESLWSVIKKREIVDGLLFKITSNKNQQGKQKIK